MDETKLHAFMGKFVTDMGGALMMAVVLIGEELGLYKAMADGRAVSADALAARCRCNPRLVREWLDANAAAGYLEHADGGYRLPPEQAMALANENSPVFVAPGTNVVGACFTDIDKVLDAFRGDGGLPWGQHHHRLFHGTEKFFRPGYKARLTTAWLPALDGIVVKLEAGAKVADVGCGHGASTIIMAGAYPKSRFFGFDIHAPSVEVARTRAAEAGVADRVTFTAAAAKGYAERGFDLICFFDCLHDMGDPVGAARHARQALSDDGTIMLVEPFAGDSVADNSNPVGRLYYAVSSMICTPNSLSQEVGLGLGAQAGERRLAAVMAEAGFSRFRRATETPFNLILEARK
ncbi:MAG: methyltransferase domain-containing protein [Candidatus Rokubacteria bacterium]|nr:methyltransferase domain-containing protein [Candidatus Rokubacteria bacterium]